MLSFVPGEVWPKFRGLNAAGTFTFALSLTNVLTTPTLSRPVVWRNLIYPWEQRWDQTPLVDGTDWTISGNNITVISMDKKDKFVIDYYHNLTPTIDTLKYWSIFLTADYALKGKIGKDFARVSKWANEYGDSVRQRLKQLVNRQILIPEFADIKLSSDYSEGPKEYKIRVLERG